MASFVTVLLLLAAYAPAQSLASVSLECDGFNMAANISDPLWPHVTDVSLIGCTDSQFNLTGTLVEASFKTCIQNLTSNSSDIIQQNTLVITYDQGDNETIERITRHTYTLRCSFDRELHVVASQVVDVSDATANFTEEGTTEFRAEMGVFDNGLFTPPGVAGPLEVDANEPIYVEVKASEVNPQLKFIVEECFATPDGNSASATQYLFFSKKCELDDTFQTIADPSSFRFQINAFTFIKVQGSVHFHCSLLVCKADTSTPACTQACATPKRKRRALNEGVLERVSVQSGEVVYKEKKTCNDITCPANSECVDLHPATCRCSQNFVLNKETGICTNENLIAISGIALDLHFRNRYFDTSSYDFLNFAQAVENVYMTMVDTDVIKGVKVVEANPGSVIIKVQVTHATGVSPKNAFNSFIRSTMGMSERNEVLKIKSSVKPIWEAPSTFSINNSAILVLAVLVPCILILAVIAIVILMKQRRSRPNVEPAHPGYDNKGY